MTGSLAAPNGIDAISRKRQKTNAVLGLWMILVLSPSDRGSFVADGRQSWEGIRHQSCIQSRRSGEAVRLATKTERQSRDGLNATPQASAGTGAFFGKYDAG
jgi:hypothetical protein